MRADEVIEMDGGYRLRINWVVYPEAELVDAQGNVIGRRNWIMTGAFFPHARIERWAWRTVKRHNRMVMRLTRDLPVVRSVSWK